MHPQRLLLLTVLLSLVLVSTSALADGWYWTSGMNLTPKSSAMSVALTNLPAGRITSTQTGDLQWVTHGFTLPGNAVIDSIAVCYRVSDGATVIPSIRLGTIFLPPTTNVYFESAVTLSSTTATCVKYEVGGISTDKAVAMLIRCNFASTGHYIDIGAFGVYLSFNGSPSAAPPSLGDFGRLGQNRPNPFNPATAIGFELKQSGPVRLQVFDLDGGLIATLVDGHLEAGSHEALWWGKDDHDRRMASGVYLYRLETSEGVESRQMTLIK